MKGLLFRIKCKLIVFAGFFAPNWAIRKFTEIGIEQEKELNHLEVENEILKNQVPKP